MSDSFLTQSNSSFALARWSSLLLAPIILFFLFSPATNESLFIWLNSHLVAWLGESFWAVITCLGDGFFLFPLGMLLVFKNPEKQQALIIAMIIAALALNIGKTLIDATRPLGVLGEALVTVVGPEVKSHSMPSGHTGTIVILAGIAILFSGNKVAIAAGILATLGGISRVAVGAHWPADIAAGAWIGLISVAIGVYISGLFKVGTAMRAFYVLLGFIPAFLLPFYDNGFQGIALVRYSQYILAALSFALALPELTSLLKDYPTQQKSSG